MSHVNIKLSHKQTPRKLTHLNTYGDLHIHTVNELSLPKYYITAFCKKYFVKFSKNLESACCVFVVLFLWSLTLLDVS